jgi:hypothetical protein
MEIYVKRATAYMVTGKSDLAHKDLNTVLAAEPGNLKVRSNMVTLDRAQSWLSADAISSRHC